MALQALFDAEARAQALLDECMRRAMIRPGVTESELSDEICALASELFGVERYWHKRLVRAGRNTLVTFFANPPERAIERDDIVFLDFGPVFGEWEADVGRTVVVGDDPHKHRLVCDLDRTWHDAAAFYRARPAITAAELHDHVAALAHAAGWQLGHFHCGHTLGRFPYERGAADDVHARIRADNPLPLRRRDAAGEPMRWILEVHLIDRAAQIGGFQEALLREADEL
jgi:Xaa-Pro dipeptidase